MQPLDIEKEFGALECEEEDCGVEKPSADESFQPYVGMEFPSYEEAYKFENSYGYINGLSIRRAGSYQGR